MWGSLERFLGKSGVHLETLIFENIYKFPLKRFSQWLKVPSLKGLKRLTLKECSLGNDANPYAESELENMLKVLPDSLKSLNLSNNYFRDKHVALVSKIDHLKGLTSLHMSSIEGVCFGYSVDLKCEGKVKKRLEKNFPKVKKFIIY